MSRLLFFLKGIKNSIKSSNWFKTFYTTKHVPFYESICSLYEHDEKPNYTKISKF